jgi:hypothetical protein
MRKRGVSLSSRLVRTSEPQRLQLRNFRGGHPRKSQEGANKVKPNNHSGRRTQMTTMTVPAPNTAEADDHIIRSEN